MKPYQTSLSFLLLILLCNCRLSAQSPQVVRGPYLQVVTPTSMVIRWRTDVPTDSRVQFGSRRRRLSQAVIRDSLTTEHEITLTGLKPATRYAYAVGPKTGKLPTDADQFFQTAPVPGSTDFVRLWVLGDFGCSSQTQYDVRDQIIKATQDHRPDVWVMLGDNTYTVGTDEEYQKHFFAHYQSQFFKNTPFYPTPGNHDYGGQIDNLKIPYFKNFTMPTKGEAGGVPSGSESFYSFDYGNIHVVSLDSYGRLSDGKRMYETGSTQLDWLRRDLAANKQPWTLVFWHHPPYSKGSHDSDTERLMVNIREQMLPILEEYKVDVVFGGHSHVYERTHPMKGHLGKNDTFDPAKHIVSAASPDSPNDYKVGQNGQGIIYIVAGSGGQLGGQMPGYPLKSAVYSNNTEGGSMLIDVKNNRLEARMIGTSGQVLDQFTIEKPAPTASPR